MYTRTRRSPARPARHSRTPACRTGPLFPGRDRGLADSACRSRAVMLAPPSPPVRTGEKGDSPTPSLPQGHLRHADMPVNLLAHCRRGNAGGVRSFQLLWVKVQRGTAPGNCGGDGMSGSSLPFVRVVTHSTHRSDLRTYKLIPDETAELSKHSNHREQIISSHSSKKKLKIF